MSLRSLCLMLGLVVAVASAHAATWTVTTLADSNDGSCGSTCSLRDAITTAASGDTIDFAAGVTGTITLGSALPYIGVNVTITGPGANLLTISGNNNVSVFTINSGVTAGISGITIANGITSGAGAGIYNKGTLTVSNCTISGNTSIVNSGGGIYNQGNLTVSNCTISGNTTQNSSGGGIYNSGTLTVSNSTLSGNTTPAGFGGGIFSYGGALTVSNSTLSGNSAGIDAGGAIYVANGTATVTNGTISGNSGYVGGIYVSSGALTLTNSIVAGNTDSLTAGDDCSGCTQSGNNLISTPTNIINPLLGPLQNNGGPTQTMLPQAGSPALGAGSGSTLATDQRGFPRPTGGGSVSDLGAVQTGKITVTTTADSAGPSAVCDGTDTCSLRDALTLANSFGSGDVVFAAGVTGTITLGSALPAIAGTLNLQGPGANLLTVSGANTYTVFTINSGVTATISGITIASGYTLTNGGGIFNQGTVTVSNCTISGNTSNNGGPISTGTGGGIYNNGTLTVSNCTITSNTAGQGGAGIFNDNGGTLTLSNSSVSGNTTDISNGGGGIFSNGSMTISNSTISGNTAGYGGGIDDLNGTISFTNSIVAGNTDSALAGDDCDGCTLTPNNLISTTTNIINPLLGPLAYNGPNQTVQTMLPLPGSLAIQAGVASTLNTDQRGATRPTGASVVSDLGAVETSYTAVQFVQQPSNTLVNGAIAPAITLNVIEDGVAALNIPVPVTLSGSGTLAGITTQSTGGSPSVASFANLSVNSVGSGDTLDVSLPITPAGARAPLTLTAISDAFDIFNPSPMITFHPPASVSYGAAPIALSATLDVTGTNAPAVSYAVDAGPATLSGNTLTITGAGTVVVEAISAASNGYAPANALANIVVTPAPLTVTMGNATSVYGAANPAFTATATGLLNGDTLGGNVIVNGTTTSTTTSPVGTYPITATLSGAAAGNYTPTIVPGKLTVTAAATTTSLGTLNSSITVGDRETLTAFVSSSVGVPAGMVTFYDGSISLGTGTLTNGVATLTTTTLPLGTDSITASYTASGNFTASTSSAAVITVSAVPTVPPAATITTLLVSSSAITLGDSEILTAAVASTAGIPTGIVTFYNGSISLGTGTLTNGVATLTTTTLPLGTDSITASYASSVNFAASTSSAVTITVSAVPTVPPAATTTTLLASSSAITLGDSEILTAAVASTAGIPTGIVTFYDGSTSLGTGTLSNGIAMLTTTTLPLGTDSITASYAASGNFTASTSSAVTIMVSSVPIQPTTPGFNFSTTASTLTIAAGGTGTLSFTLTPAGGYTGTINLSCASLPAHATCTFSPATATFGTSPVTIMLTVATNVTTAQLEKMPMVLPTTPLNNLPMLPAILFWLPEMTLEEGKQKASKKKSSRMLWMAALFALTLGAWAISGCGGSSSTSSASTVGGTPLGKSTLTIVAQGTGGVSQLLPVTITIQ